MAGKAGEMDEWLKECLNEKKYHMSVTPCITSNHFAVLAAGESMAGFKNFPSVVTFSG